MPQRIRSYDTRKPGTQEMSNTGLRVLFSSLASPKPAPHREPCDEDMEGFPGMAPATAKATTGRRVQGRAPNLGRPEQGGGRGTVRLERGLPAEGLAPTHSPTFVFFSSRPSLGLNSMSLPIQGPVLLVSAVRVPSCACTPLSVCPSLPRSALLSKSF